MNFDPLPTNKSWSLFLDRDGVINRRLPDAYVRNWEEFRFIEGVPEALALLGRHFGHLIVVTNQQGIGKKLMSVQDMEAVHRRMRQEIESAGGRIDAIYHCPGLAEEDPPCRKPNTGMARQAKRDFPEINFQHSVMVGDSLSDMEFGARLEMINVLIETKREALEKLQHGHFPFKIHYRFGSLLDFARFIERSSES